MADLTERVSAAAAEDRLWARGEAILVGLSGGPDSTALLSILAQLRDRLDLRLYAAYFDHGLRGQAGEVDGDRAEALAHDLGVQFRRGAGAVRPQGFGLEDAARRARYTFLGQEAERAGCTTVAVGHHRDDQAETVLLRLARGSGLRGLGGMAPVAAYPVPGFPCLRLIRPLLGYGRAEILAHLRGCGLPFRVDETNVLVRQRRNLLRAQVIPHLVTAFGPGVPQAIARAAESLREDEDALGTWAAREAERCIHGGRLRVEALGQLPLAVRWRVVRRWWSQETGLAPLPRALTLAVAEAADRGPIDLPGGWRVSARRGWLRLGAPAPDVGAPAVLPCPGEAPLGPGTSVVATTASWPDAALFAQVQADPDLAVGDLDRVRLPLAVRRARPGERFHPLGAPQERSVRSVATTTRMDRWVVVGADNAVLWVVGARPSATFRVEADTRHALVLEVRWSGLPDSLS